MIPGFMSLLPGLAPVNDRQLGYIASWDLNVMACAIAASAFLLHRIDWRWLVAAGLLLIAAGNAATGLAHSYLSVVLARVVAGAGEGLAIGVSFAALGRAGNPDRAFSVYLVAGAAFSSVLLWGLPELQRRFGAPALFFGAAGLAVPVAMMLRWFPHGRLPDDAARSSVRIDRRLAVAGLVGVFFYFMAQGGMWGYLERIGQAHHLGADQISRALAIANFAGIGGAAAASLVPRRLGRGLPLLISGAVSALSFQLLLGGVSGLVLLVAAVLLTFAWNFSQPLLSGLCCDADPQGRVVAAMGSIQTFGTGFGPAAAALVLTGGDFTPVIWGSCIVLALSLAVILAGLREPFAIPRRARTAMQP
jgi:predicted MFS family arabinose efflux permease